MAKFNNNFNFGGGGNLLKPLYNWFSGGKNSCYSDESQNIIVERFALCNGKILKLVQNDIKNKNCNNEAQFTNHYSLSSKLAFTLAEVLITLGIIGVVAAMTIPTLIANTKSLQYRNRFKKAISTLSQAGRMSASQYDFDYAGIDKGGCRDPKTDHPDSVMSICALFNGTLTGITYSRLGDLKVNSNGALIKYQVKANSTVGRDHTGNDNIHTYTLQDGTLILLHPRFGQNTPCSKSIGSVLKDDYSATLDGLSACTALIDVNGTNLPNTEVSCTSGSNLLSDNNTCIVENNAKNMTDVFPVRLHDGVAEPATPAARYVLQTAR